jgi:hypothetical protein
VHDGSTAAWTIGVDESESVVWSLDLDPEDLDRVG